VKDNLRGRLVFAMCGWLAFVLLAAPFAYAAERGVVLVLDAQGEQAKSATARTALVIGNSSYPGAPLRNPVNDATDVAEALRGLGFEVVLSLDVDKRVLMQAIRKFQKRLQRRGGVGLFYYAGHGIQVEGRNYLIPVGADIETETDIEYAAVDAGVVLGYMEEADARLNIVILDACRDNPVERSWRSASRGLARLELPPGPLGSLLAYSTAPGKVAADGTGRNSPFTTHLLLNLRIAGLDLEDVFKKTRIGVKRDTDGKQIPWSESSLVGDFYFREPTQAGAETPVTVPQPPKHTPQKAKLTVRSNVYQDKVYIDGQEMGSTRLDVELAPGRHSVRIEKKGYMPYEETVELDTGHHAIIHATLGKAPVMVERAEPMTPKRPSVHFGPFDAKSVYGAVRDGRALEHSAFEIRAPGTAENGAVVPVTLAYTGGETGGTLWVFVEDHSPPAALAVKLGDTAQPYLSTRLKLTGGTTTVLGAYQDPAGRLYAARKKIEVTVSGGSAQLISADLTRAPRDASDVSGGSGKSMKSRARVKDGVTTIKLLLKHPMETGERVDARTHNTIPAHYIQQLVLRLGGHVVINAYLTPSIAKNPYFSFELDDVNLGDRYTFSWVDNRGGEDSHTETAK